MSANDFETLHDKSEPRMPHGKLISMLEIMGGEISCDVCGRWQRLGVLSEVDGRAKAAASGWRNHDGKDICKICSGATV